MFLKEGNNYAGIGRKNASKQESKQCVRRVAAAMEESCLYNSPVAGGCGVLSMERKGRTAQC